MVAPDGELPSDRPVPTRPAYLTCADAGPSGQPSSRGKGINAHIIIRSWTTPYKVAPPPAHLQIGFVHMPVAAAGTALAVTAPAEFVAQQRRELGLPLADRFVAEDDAALEEHLGQITQGQPVAQPPQHHQRDDVRGVLRPVQHPGTAFVELLAAIPAPEAPVALGGALRPLRHSGQAAGHT